MKTLPQPDLQDFQAAVAVGNGNGDLAIEPAATVRWIHDPFGNSIAIATFKGETDHLDLTSTIRLEHFAVPVERPPLEDYARTLPFSYATEEVPDLARYIERHYPDHGIHGEEYGVKQGRSPFTWVLDPVDGTRAFVSELYASVKAGAAAGRLLGLDATRIFAKAHFTTKPARDAVSFDLRQMHALWHSKRTPGRQPSAA